MPGRPRGALSLTAAERDALEDLLRRRSTSQALALRAKIVLACSEGQLNVDIADQLGVSRDTVSKWRSRFLAAGLAALQDRPRPGAPRRITDERVGEVIRRTLEGPGPSEVWSTRSMAAAMGMSQSAVSRIWRAHGLQPQSSHDSPQPADPPGSARRPRLTGPSAAQVVDIVGLFLHPPGKCLALSTDALPAQAVSTDVLSTGAVGAGRMAVRAVSGTGPADGRGHRHSRQHHEEFLRFLQLVDGAVPVSFDVHLICDRRTPHAVPVVRDWLRARPRFQVHLTPAAGNWLSTFERWFAELAGRRADRRADRRGDRRDGRPADRCAGAGNGRPPWGPLAAPQPVVWVAAAGE